MQQPEKNEQNVLELKPGNYLGKYRLRKCLSTGGSCEVWQARDSIEGIWVALKIPLLGINGRRDNSALLREVSAVSKLRHPNILSIRNADIINGHTVMATELSTRTLADCSRPMSTARIISIMIQVLKGLAYAHKQRIVHCDVTPSNVFLFENKRAAIGDFGISLKVKGRAKTVDDFGTPGYVAPEQAYGYPTYKSDTFSVGLILYEYITGVLPRWPFNWPYRGYKRLRERSGTTFVKFMKKSLSVDPEKRYPNAGKMLDAMLENMPRSLKAKTIQQTDTIMSLRQQKDWRKVRRETFIKKYQKIFPVLFHCVECDEPITESMQVCPWCGSDKNRFDTRSWFSHICPRCHKGMLPEWPFCPWCYGYKFSPQKPEPGMRVNYHARCDYCNGRLLRFMRYCPWCRRKLKTIWIIRPFPQECNYCGWPVDSEFWDYCPWCRQSLTS